MKAADNWSTERFSSSWNRSYNKGNDYARAEKIQGKVFGRGFKSE